MQRRTVLTGLASSLLTACETLDPAIIDGVLGGSSGFGLTQADAALGIRAALDKGVGNAVSNVGVLDGFLGNNLVRIPLPSVLQNIQSYLSPIGADGLLVELQQQLNRGAEKAVPAATDIFLGAISQLTIPDAIAIVQGADTAATSYLQNKTTGQLSALFSPVMKGALNETGALRLVDQLSSSLQGVPFAPQLGNMREDLVTHGVDYGLRGLFHYVGEEEKAIRANPAARTSEILRRVFA